MSDISPHQKPIGTGFTAKSTALEVAASHDLGGKTVVITGGYSGLGLETTRAFAACGATVYIPARRRDQAAKAVSAIDGKITVVAMDLSDFASVEKAARDLVEAIPSLDFLINNAGVMACPLRRVREIFEYQFATNHLGHFLLTRGLMPSLQAGEGARIVALSSAGHRLSAIRFDDPHFNAEPYDKWLAYGQSKTANSLFTVGLDQRFGEAGITANAVHPGGIFTPLQRHLGQEEMVALGWLAADGSMPPAVRALFKTPEQGASTTMVAALSPKLDGLGGLYLEDGDVAAVATEESPRYLHVRPYAISAAAAAQLWSMTEALLA